MQEQEAVMPEVLIRPAHNQKCIAEVGLTPTGKARVCPSNARMIVADKPLCSCHTERAMEAHCGRKVSLAR